MSIVVVIRNEHELMERFRAAMQKEAERVVRESPFFSKDRHVYTLTLDCGIDYFHITNLKLERA